MLSEAEGHVVAVAWCGQFCAWASALGVRVYDLHERCSLGMIKWEEPTEADGGRLTDYRCNLRWATASTLLIGWVDTIRVCVIRKRNATEVARTGQPGWIVDPVATFQTDFFVCGLAPLVAGDQIIVLGQLKERDEATGDWQRPIVCVMQYTSCAYQPICTSSITMRGFEVYRPRDYHLECLDDEHTYFIVAPKDLIVATLCEYDDRIQWLINHRKFDKALMAIAEHGGRYSQLSVARLYIDHLLLADRFEQAAEVCRCWFGNDRELWEEEVYKFVKRKQLLCLRAHLPHPSECRLSPHIYEMVLYEYLKSDAAGFRELVFEWPATLYNTTVLINAIKEHLGQNLQQKMQQVHEQKSSVKADAGSTGKTTTGLLFEALAFLYTVEKRYGAALELYLRLQNGEVFTLIRQHRLYAHIVPNIVALIELDRKQAIKLLLEMVKSTEGGKESDGLLPVIESDVVVKQLEGHKKYLYWVSVRMVNVLIQHIFILTNHIQYLDALDKVDRSGRYHTLLIPLYADYDRDLLLPFLRRAHNYNIQTVLDLCRERSFFKEMVYLLGCVGNNAETLQVYLHQMHDFAGALEFCRRMDDIDLWMVLVEFALAKATGEGDGQQPELLCQLMDGVVGFLDPRVLVQKIGPSVRVKGLRESLRRMLADVSLQSAIQAKCNDVLMVDYFGLHRRVLRSERRAVWVAGESVCGWCGQALIVRGECDGIVCFYVYNIIAFFRSSLADNMRDIVAFNCRHLFHGKCHEEAVQQHGDFCSICKSSKHGPMSANNATGGSTLDT